jgi:hypothetical protein
MGEIAAIGPRSLQVTAPINPGNSGGPVIDDQGRIVGVVSRHLRGDGLGFAGRADALQELIDDPKKPFPIGGTYGAELVGFLWNGDRGTYSLGIRGQVSIRNHLFFDLAGATAIAPRLDAIENGEVAWDSSEVRGGLRQRLFDGPYTIVFEAWGGLATIERRTLREGTFEVLPSADRNVLIGGSVRFPGVGIGLEGGSTLDGEIRLGLTAAWPGMVGIF